MDKYKLGELITDKNYEEELKLISRIIAKKSYPLIITTKSKFIYSEKDKIIIGIPEFLYKDYYDIDDLNILLKGFVIHESEHLISSNYEEFEKFGEVIYEHYKNKYNMQYAYFYKNVALFINNALEDGRIELINMSKYPNNTMYIKYMNAIFFYENPIKFSSKSPQDKLLDLIQGILYYSTIDREPQNWEFLYLGTIEEKMLFNLKKYIDKAKFSASHKEVCEIAFDIILYLESYINKVLQDVINNGSFNDLNNKITELSNNTINPSCNGRESDISSNKKKETKNFYDQFVLDKNAIKALEKTKVKAFNEENKENRSLEEDVLEEDKDKDFKILKYNIIAKQATSAANDIFFLEKEIKSILNKYKYYTSANQGLIDTKKIWRVSVKDENIFKKKLYKKSIDICVSLLIDSSGSMEGRKIRTAHKATSIIESSLSKLISMEIIYFNSTETNNHYIIKEFDQHEDYKSFNEGFTPTPEGKNKDGLHLNLEIERIKNRKEKNKFIIILSDGLPSHYPSLEEGIEDIKKSINYAKENKINVICIAIDESIDKLYKNKRYYQQMYKNLILSQEKDIGANLIKLMKNLMF